MPIYPTRQVFLATLHLDASVDAYLSAQPTNNKGKNANEIWQLIQKMGEVNDEDSFADALEENYPSIYNKILGNDEGEDKFEKRWLNFKKVRDTLRKSRARPKDYLKKEALIAVIINSKGDITKEVEDLQEYLLKLNNIKEAKRILNLKGGREKALNTKLQTYFANEKKPKVSGFLSQSVPAYNYCYIGVELNIPKKMSPNLSSIRKELGWSLKKGATNPTLQKITEIKSLKREQSEIIQAIKSLDGEGQVKVEIKVDFPVLYELLVKSDYQLSNMARLKREDKSKMKVTKGNPANKELLQQYFKLLSSGDRKTEKVKDVSMGMVEKVSKLLLISPKKQNVSDFTKNYFNYKKTSYFEIPFYKTLLDYSQAANTISASMDFIKQGAKIDRDTYLKYWINVKAQNDKAKKKILTAKFKAAKKDLREEDDDVKEFEKDYEEKTKSPAFKLYSMEFIDLLIELEAIDEGFKDNLEPYEKDKKTLYASKDVEQANKLLALFNKGRILAAARKKNIDLDIETKALLSPHESTKSYKTSLGNAIAHTIISKGDNTLKEVLHTKNSPLFKEGTTIARQKPLTLQKALYLACFIAKRYSGLSITDKVEKIDSNIAAGLSIETDTMKTDIAALEDSLEKAIKAFYALLITSLDAKITDIVNNKDKYFNVYNSSAINTLIKIGLINREK